MNSIIDRIILLIFATLTCFLCADPNIGIIPLLVVISITSINEFFANQKLALTLFFGYLILCFFIPSFIIFSPVLLYDLFHTRFQLFGFFAFLPLFVHFSVFSISEVAILLCIACCALWLRKKTIQHATLQQQFITQRDTLTELSITLEQKVAELMQKQDDDVTLATLNERTRIAREIHDNVGHLLSSSILQLGALMAITKDESTKQNLSILKDTLSTGMDSIRSSVHNLQDNAVDLYSQVNRIVKEFTFCKAELNYDMTETIPIQSRYAVIAIVKEALANVIKHSNATHVTISLYEHPKLYQLIISDNGTKKSANSCYGMGLDNMKQRVAGLNGIINISDTNGFRIFISFPKETKH
ncbi:histidine kinase [Paludicola sp. MB14-C6]|uniref:sensor histidine kinase n=1 Tax=Paludihabitans sp. MB14-C6 TaxID=3070656 RepID=UPI0027DAE690|nr:histidine kinase [Paludicola sp. MB14-C6]WMJ24148.1 histidine kinase [Paludicola sp. MB14-C6]